MRPQNRRDALSQPGATPKRVAARGLAAVALAVLVGAVFFPVVGFEFVDYDVRAQVLDNPQIRALHPENLTLAEVYAQTGRSRLAAATIEKAIRVAEAAGNPALADQLRRRLKRYQDQDADRAPSPPGD